ncbi:MAG: hypothetical protein HOP33_08260 [Verrucomicrobia bacterium]|nr:hypothetical protein [Verrucomicrobiota bacterium]
MQNQINIMKLVDLNTVPETVQVWIIPGSHEDREDGEYSDWFIMDYLRERGICLAKGLNGSQPEIMVEDVRKKFESQGFEVVIQLGAND